MGHVCHNAIVVTSFQDETIKAARAKAVELGCPATEIVRSNVNAYYTFLIAPDGSKEGWADSEEGDRRRSEFRDWTRSVRYEDDSSPLEWVEVSYGSDEWGCDIPMAVVAHEWSDRP